MEKLATTSVYDINNNLIALMAPFPLGNIRQRSLDMHNKLLVERRSMRQKRLTLSRGIDNILMVIFCVYLSLSPLLFLLSFGQPSDLGAMLQLSIPPIKDLSVSGLSIISIWQLKGRSSRAVLVIHTTLSGLACNIPNLSALWLCIRRPKCGFVINHP